jgi:hypothetical protein
MMEPMIETAIGMVGESLLSHPAPNLAQSDQVLRPESISNHVVDEFRPVLDQAIAAEEIISRKRLRPAKAHTTSMSTFHKKRTATLNSLGTRIRPLDALGLWSSGVPLLDTFAGFLLAVSDSVFHHATLVRLWHVVVSALQSSEFHFKRWVRPKSSQVLKRQLEDMIALEKFSIEFKPATQCRSMATALAGGTGPA